VIMLDFDLIFNTKCLNRPFWDAGRFPGSREAFLESTPSSLLPFVSYLIN
jgi:hypothetical protein